MLRKIGFFIIYLSVAVIHFLVTFVVVLFLLSTLNILNQSVFYLEKPEYIEKAVTAAIFIISAVVFFKSLEKISQRIKITFFKNNLP